MKIAFLVSRFPALSETFIVNQIVGLIDAGHEVDVYARRPPPGEAAHAVVGEYGLIERTRYRPERPGGLLARLRQAAAHYRAASPPARRVLRRALSPRRWGREALSLRPFYEALGCEGGRSYDVIHCHFGSRGVIGHRLRELGALRGPLVVSFHGEDATAALSRRRLAAYRRVFTDGELITVNSPFIGERVRQLGCPSEKIVRVRMAIDPGAFRFHERSLPQAGRIELLSVGRLVEVKGLAYAIRAVAALVPRYPRLRYRIVGEGPLRAGLAGLIEELNLSGHVELLGARVQAEVARLYEASHVFVMPSTTIDGKAEGQGLVLQEAQASGLPVVASRSGGIPDSVAPESARLVAEGDVGALGGALADLLEHPQAWPAMGRAGRRLVEQEFTIARTTERLVEAYGQARARYERRP